MASTSPAELTKVPPDALKTLPALEPPAGMKPNFVSLEDRAHILNATTTVLLCLMVCFFANRIYAKLFISRKTSWDDLTCTIAFLCSIVLYTWSTILGRVGNHQWNIRSIDAVSGNSVTTSAIVVFLSQLTLLFAKITFFLFYFQVFWILRWLRICVYIGATVTCAFYGAISIAQVVMLIPRHGETWLEHSSSKESLRAQVLSVYLSAVGLGIDVAILVIPIAAVVGIQVSAKRKMGVMIIFLFGFLACVGSLLSIYYRVLQRRNPDITWNIMAVKQAALVEIFLGISCACMPALSMTLHHHHPALERLRSMLSSRLGRFGSLEFDDKARLSAHRQCDGPKHFPMAKTGQGPYDHLEVDLKLPRATYQPKYDMAPLQSLRTSDGKGWDKGLSNDKIHLMHET